MVTLHTSFPDAFAGNLIMGNRVNGIWGFIGSAKIGNQYQSFRPEYDHDKILESLTLAEQFLPAKVLMVCERGTTPAVHYVGPNSEKILSYTSNEMKKKSVHDFLQLVHPDDRALVGQCYEHINKYEPYDPTLFRFETRYRLKRKDGSYEAVIDGKSAVKTIDNKYIYITSFEVASDDKFLQVRLDVFQFIKDDFRKMSTYNPRQHTESVTPRQHEIMHLIAKGFSNREIADRLNISIHTIKNHKYSIFKKVHVKNSIELARTMKG